MKTTKRIILFIASKDESDLLLSDELDKLPIYTLITGYGMGGAIYNMREYSTDCIVLNIGFCGAPTNMKLTELYSISTSILGPNINNFNKPKVIKTIKDLPQLPCITVNDFETNPDRFYPDTCYSKEYVIDMELYPLANYFDTVYALKIPSDHGDLKEYFTQDKNKIKLSKLRSQIHNIIIDLLQD